MERITVENQIEDLLKERERTVSLMGDCQKHLMEIDAELRELRNMLKDHGFSDN